MEKAKEHYMDRLRREWQEADAEAAVKARIAEEVAANAICQSRPMYSSTCEDVSGSSESTGVDFVEAIVVEGGDGIVLDAEAIAAQIEEERKKQLDLLSKLFPEDKDSGDEEEKVIEIAKLRAFPLPTDVNAKKRKHDLDISSASVVTSSVQPNEDESGGAGVLKSSTHESEALDFSVKQKSKTRRVKFSEEADERSIESLNDENATVNSQHEDLFELPKGVRSILKKSQEDSEKVDADRNGDGDGNEEDEEEEEEYYPSSRSPSPEGGLSDESKWERLFKYAGLKKGVEVTKPSDAVSSNPGLTLWTGISLDVNDGAEPAVAEVDTLHRGAVMDDGLFSGVLSEKEEESDPSHENNLGVTATDSVYIKKKKNRVTGAQQDGVGNDGIFSGVLSDPGEDTDSPEPSVLGSELPDSVALKKSKKLTETPETSSDTLPDQGEESSGFEDADEDSHNSESDASGDSELYEEDDEDEDMDDFVDAAPGLKIVAPIPLNEASKASKWENMFKSATSVAEPVEGVFSGSLDEADVPGRPRAVVSVPRMFESATMNRTGSVSESPKILDAVVASEVMEDVSIRSSEEENATLSSEDIPDPDVAQTVKDDKTDASEEEEVGASHQQTGGMSGNLLERFNMEQNEPESGGAQSSGDGQQGGLDPGNEGDREGLGASSSIPILAVDENTKWMQRATWKSLMGADGRATFSLKQVTGESESTKAAENDAVPEQSLNAFSFNFARNPPKDSEPKRKPLSIERADLKQRSVSAVKNIKPAKVTEDETGCSFMKSADSEKEWRASKAELRIDSKAKHKAALRKMKKMKGSGGAR